MIAEDLLYALSSDPAGIQITLYPDRCTIDLGYGSHWRIEGQTLCQAAHRAAQIILGTGSPSIVVRALERLNASLHPEERVTPAYPDDAFFLDGPVT